MGFENGCVKHRYRNGDENLRDLEREAAAMEPSAMAAFVRAGKRAGLDPTAALEKMLGSLRPKTGAPTIDDLETIGIELWEAIKVPTGNEHELDRAKIAAWTTTAGYGLSVNTVRRDKQPQRGYSQLDTRSRRYMPVVLAVVDGGNVTIGAGVVDVDQGSPEPFTVWPIEFGSLEGQTASQFLPNFHPQLEGIPRPEFTENLLAWARHEDTDRVRMSRTEAAVFLMTLELTKHGPAELAVPSVAIEHVGVLTRAVKELLDLAHITGHTASRRERHLTVSDIEELLYELLEPYGLSIVSTMNGAGTRVQREIRTYMATIRSQGSDESLIDIGSLVRLRPQPAISARSHKADFAIAIRDKDAVTLAIRSARIDPRGNSQFYPWLDPYTVRLDDLLRFARLEAVDKIRIGLETARTFAAAWKERTS